MADGIAVTRDGHKHLAKMAPRAQDRDRSALHRRAHPRRPEARRQRRGRPRPPRRWRLRRAARFHARSRHHRRRSGRRSDRRRRCARCSSATPRAGRPAHRPMLFEDLCALIAAGGDISPDAVLQLDLKEEARGARTARWSRACRQAVGADRPPLHPLRRPPGGHRPARRPACPASPSASIPATRAAIDRLVKTRDFARFVADAVARVSAAPK